MKNILIVEDSKIINNVIKKELSSLGFAISQAFNYADAKRLINTKNFDLIILDLHLPDGEGSELIANIQSLTKTKVVVLTSSQDENLREELFQYGIIDYIIKDKNLLYSITEIIKIINTVTTHLQHKEKILIIDDSKFVCKQVKTMLEPRNYTLKSAYTAKDGLGKLEKNRFDLIILDMELPDMHGIKVLELIRKDSKFLHIPIIVLSGTSTPDIIRNVLKNGANDFLKKPFIFEEFILKVDLWIDYFKKDKELLKKTNELEHINKNLRSMVDAKVKENLKKDRLMFSQSRHAQMGEMIAMIAHQWRQPLNAISAATSVVTIKINKEDFDKEATLRVVNKIRKYVEHLSNTIDDFREFFKPQKEKKQSDFETIFNKAFSLIESSLNEKDIKLDLNMQDVEYFFSYENELVQVVLNILKNAEDALVEKQIKQPKIFVEIKNKNLTISDNAGGIPHNIIEKIFDPYFSTKEQKNGTGLGLYMSKIIVENHCLGSLNIENIHNGAKFTISLSDNSGSGEK